MEYPVGVLVMVVVLQAMAIVGLLIHRARSHRAGLALREREERFRLIADGAPVILWTARPDRTLEFVNTTCVAFMGMPLQQLLDEGWWSAVHPGDADHATSVYVSAFEAYQPFLMEFRVRRADGAYRWLLGSGVPKYAADGRFAGYIGCSIDITDRKNSEDALRDNQQRYTMATAAGGVGVWDWDFAANEMYIDPVLKSRLGFADAEISRRGADWGLRVHPDDLAMVSAHAQSCIEGRSAEYEVEHRMIHKDGSVRWFLSRGSVLRHGDGASHRMVGTKVDITERKRAEEATREKEAFLSVSAQEIQHLMGRLIAAQEVERTRIARDLHDDTSQQLAGVAIALSGLKRRLGTLTDVGDLLAQVGSLQQRISAVGENVRQISHDLHPNVLQHGLVIALSGYCAEVRKQRTLDLTFDAEGNFDSVGAGAALCLFRVAQEALRNVVVHADARHASVRLMRIGDDADLTITDDGKGFGLIGVRADRTGLGLVSINERVRLSGGTVDVTSELNRGTVIHVRIPANQMVPGAGSGSGVFPVTV